MKRIYLFIISVLFSYCSTAQQINATKTATMTLPKNAEKLTKRSMISQSKKLFSDSEIQKDPYLDNFYKIGDVSLAFRDNEVSDEELRTLPQVKAETLEYLKLDKSIVVNDASIKTFNGHQFFIINYQKGNTNSTRFLSETRNHKLLSGVMEFKAEDKSKAENALTNFLQSIKFKNIQ